MVKVVKSLKENEMFQHSDPFPQVDCHKHERHNTSKESATTAKRRHVMQGASCCRHHKSQLEF
jgi:hypothetical protein